MNLLVKLILILKPKKGPGNSPSFNDWQWQDGTSLMWEDNTEILTE